MTVGAVRLEPAAEVVVTCRGVSYRYGDDAWANRAIDLDLRRGELLCLLGPNGAGKTTLIRQIVGDLRPTEGEVRVLGRDPHTDAVAKRSLGVIPQAAGLFGSITTRRHLELFAPLKGSDGSDVESLIETCELGDVADKRVSALSGGQQRRLLLGLALLGTPEVLVLDEPTVGLDPTARRSVWQTIRAQCRAGRSVVLTTHYLDEAERLADRVGFVEGGQIRRLGTLGELFAAVGRTMRVSELDPETAAPARQHYFDTLAEAQAFVRERALDAYAVQRITLEDVYLRLLGHPLDGPPADSASAP